MNGRESNAPYPEALSYAAALWIVGGSWELLLAVLALSSAAFFPSTGRAVAVETTGFASALIAVAVICFGARLATRRASRVVPVAVGMILLGLVRGGVAAVAAWTHVVDAAQGPSPHAAPTIAAFAFLLAPYPCYVAGGIFAVGAQDELRLYRTARISSEGR
jgi:energy-coupling factor transporter transmembrane protein EcfT